jgi:hypothetical protein
MRTDTTWSTLRGRREAQLARVSSLTPARAVKTLSDSFPALVATLHKAYEAKNSGAVAMRPAWW